MTRFYWLIIVATISLVILIFALRATMGAGGFERMVKISGLYSVCRPDGYPVVCFLDADSKDGGMFCIPLSTIGGECKK